MYSKIGVLSAGLLVCVSFALAAQSKADISLHRIEVLLKIYGKEHPLKEYPSTLKEFEKFAATKGTPLDLTPFSEFSFKRSGRSLEIWYRRKDTGVADLISWHSITVY